MLEQHNTENVDGPGLGEGSQWLSWIWESTGGEGDNGTGMLDSKSNA